MVNVKLIRIDTRMIHGQIATKWADACKAENIILVDKVTANDSFMAKFYKNAAPKGIKDVEVLTPEQAMEAYNNGTLPDGNAFVIFKDVKNCYELYKLGFPMEAIDLGNQVSKSGKKQVLREVFLSPEEYDKLKEMHDTGVNVYIQLIPEQPQYDFKFITDKMS